MSEASTPSPAQVNQPGRYRRTFSGLVASMLAALGLIAAVWGLTWFQHRDIADPSPAVDYLPQLAQARAAAPFAVLAPDPPPSGWRATSVSWDGSALAYAWHLGFLTGGSDDVEYVGLEQSDAEPAEFVAASTRADQPGSPVVVDGRRWQTMTSSDGRETALVRSTQRVTTIVTGSATENQLIAFIKTLSAD